MRKWLFDLFKSPENPQEEAPGTSSNMEIAAGFVLALVVLFLFVLTNEAIRKSNAKKLARIAAAHVNRLKDSPDPYLRASAALGVDWYPMGEEALTAATVQNKPIFISSGYASHWSNVMDRDLFQDPEVAAALNQGFICIRIDRELRPDVDAFCMDAQVVLTSRASWPVNVWLTPDFKPFHAAEFATASEFVGVVKEISRDWLEDTDKIKGKAEKVFKNIVAMETAKGGGGGVLTGNKQLLAGLERDMLQQEDRQNGGIGSVPRLPHLPTLISGITLAGLEPKSLLSELAVRAGKGMLGGALRDQVNGGYFRYCDDAAWRKPHFEKVLADQALFALFYFDLAADCDRQNQSSGEPWRKEGAAVLRFVTGNMKLAGGGFGTMLGPDVDAGEGASYTWTRSKVAQTLEGDAVDQWCSAYGVVSRRQTRRFCGKRMGWRS